MNSLLSDLKQSLGERRCRFRCLCAISILLMTFVCLWFIGPEQARLIVRTTGYYFTLVTSVGLCIYLFRWAQGLTFREIPAKELLVGVVSVLAGTWVMFVHADFDYKIAMDDYLLAGTAKHIHESREVARPEFGRHIGRTFVTMSAEVDERPWFYPFVVATVHDLVGYREANPFIVNAAAGILFLSGVYLFGSLLGGRVAGVCSVLLWVTSPLLAQNATGAGMEMLNLFMLQLLFLFAAFYLRRPCSELEGALSLIAVLLTYTRYESGLFLIPVAIVIALGWLRERKLILSWGTVLAAPLLLGVVLQTRIYAVTQSSWELSDSMDVPFSLSAIMKNFPHALNFFFGVDHGLANSLLLSLLGIPAILAFFVMLRTEAVKYWKSNPAGLVTALFGFFLIVHLLIVLSFHASELDSLFVSRYALPFHWLLVFALIALLAYAAEKWPVLWRGAIGICLLFVFAVTLPMNAKAIFSKQNFVVREYHWLEDLSRDSMAAHSLIIDQYTASWALREWSVLEPHVVLLHAERIRDEIVANKYPSVYFIERMHYDGTKFVADYPVFEQLHQRFAMELLDERSFRPFELTRVYRLTGYLPAKLND